MQFREMKYKSNRHMNLYNNNFLTVAFIYYRELRKSTCIFNISHVMRGIAIHNYDWAYISIISFQIKAGPVLIYIH